MDSKTTPLPFGPLLYPSCPSRVPCLGVAPSLCPRSRGWEAEPGRGWRVRSGQGVRQKREQLGGDGKGERGEFDLAPGGAGLSEWGALCWVWGAAPPEIQGPLFPSSLRSPPPPQAHIEELWNVRIHLGGG